MGQQAAPLRCVALGSRHIPVCRRNVSQCCFTMVLPGRCLVACAGRIWWRAHAPPNATLHRRRWILAPPPPPSHRGHDERPFNSPTLAKGSHSPSLLFALQFARRLLLVSFVLPTLLAAYPLPSAARVVRRSIVAHSCGRLASPGRCAFTCAMMRSSRHPFVRMCLPCACVRVGDVRADAASLAGVVA